MRANEPTRAEIDRAQLGDAAVESAFRRGRAMAVHEQLLDALLELDIFLGELRRAAAVRFALRSTKGTEQPAYERFLAGVNGSYHMNKGEKSAELEAVEYRKRLESRLSTYRGTWVNEPVRAAEGMVDHAC